MASSFFEKLLLQKDDKSLSARARREHASIMSLYGSAPGQNLDTAKGTLWGAVNAVSYYVDHVRSVRVGDRLDNAWFGAGGALKDRAWAAACALLYSLPMLPNPLQQMRLAKAESRSPQSRKWTRPSSRAGTIAWRQAILSTTWATSPSQIHTSDMLELSRAREQSSHDHSACPALATWQIAPTGKPRYRDGHAF